MKFLKQGIALAVMGAGLAAAPTLQAQAQPAAPDDLVSKIKQNAEGSVTATRSPATGKIAFLAARGKGADLLPDVAARTAADAVAKADAYLDRYAPAFGARSAELKQTGVLKGKHGTTVTYVQNYEGLPVFGSAIKVNVDAQGDLVAVNGYAAPGLNLSTDPGTSAEKIAKVAVAWVKQDPPKAHEGKGKADTTGIAAKDTKLVVYRTGAIKGEPGKAVLAYQVEVTNGANIRDMLVFDAENGKILNRYSMIHGALDRELYELDPQSTPVWQEGDPFPGGLNPDQQNLVNSAGESYWLYNNAFGRDSYDGAGATMKTVNNDPDIDCPNANWNGATTNYCDGVTSDDVVSHEWGHAYTEYTSGLIYQFQSGALNESYSDVWGETLDLINGREDEGENFQTPRPMECEATAPAGIVMSILAPASIAGPCNAVEAGFGPGFGTTPVTPDVVVGRDAADAAGASTTDGCSAYTNAAAVAGKYAYVDRGSCTFQVKADNAVAAGATGIVVGNNNVDFPISMSGTSTIPGVMVTKADGAKFKSVAGPVKVSIAAEDTTTRNDSTRWLMGEKSTAFGGAIRDMWMPTCYGDPGKVTDAEYKCDPTMGDNGGVHSNSGVPNHAYALLVDGGTYNGHTIASIGLDKAANIWWRAQSAYLTPTSNFVDAANAFEQSCADLVGQPINKISTETAEGPTPATPITAADCTQVSSATAAVEMRTDPERCDFQPLLDKNTPALCGEGFVTEALWSEDFEDGLAGWGTDQELFTYNGTTYGGFGMPWEATKNAPGNHPGGVAYGPAPDGVGDCSLEGPGSQDFSSRDSIISPIVELPGELRTPRLTFDHYMAVESGYDGGNVKVSINGGDFEVIPASAYIFNAPKSTLLTLGQNSTNPLGGEQGFTGTDGGQVKGSWGQSQVDMTAMGAAPGDTVQFRFDIGRDGCGGVDGWYVDNIQIVQCKLPVNISATHQPEPSVYGQASSVKVKVDRKGNAGSTPTGEVTLTKADGTVLGEATLDEGKANIALPADLPVGVHTLTATYEGTSSLAKASTNVKVTVVPAGTKPPEGKVDSVTKAKLKPRAPEFRENFKVKVKVTAEGTTSTGKVVIRIDGKKAGKGMLKDGRLTVKVKKNYTIGKHKLVAKYKGSDTVEGSKDKLRFRIRRG